MILMLMEEEAECRRKPRSPAAALAQVAADLGRLAGAGMGASQGPNAYDRHCSVSDFWLILCACGKGVNQEEHLPQSTPAVVRRLALSNTTGSLPQP
jgi:hypothetical protein